MKICILNVHHTPFDKRVFHKVGKSLVAAGHDVLSVVPSNESVADTGGLRFTTIPVARNLPHRCVSVLRLIRAGWKAKADVYLGVEPESWVAGLVIRLFTGRKVVFDVHEYVPTEFAKFFPSFLQDLVAWITLKAMRVLARFTDHVILTRESFDGQFKGLRVPRSVVINTNHLQPKCREVPAALLAAYGGRPTVIHQGLFGDVRGSWQLLDAMKIVAKKHPDVKCILLGDYVYGSEEEYRKGIQEAGLDGVIDLVASVPFEEVPPYIAVSDVGLILFQPGSINHTLAMPHKMFDYMREGKPVIAPDFAVEVGAIMTETDCGIAVDVTCPEAIAEAIVGLLEDGGEAKRLGENGRKGVETKYNWQEDEKRLIEAFASLE